MSQGNMFTVRKSDTYIPNLQTDSDSSRAFNHGQSRIRF